MALATYSIRQIACIAAGVPLVFEELSVEQEENDWEKEVDADGVVVRSLMNNKSATLSLTVSRQQTVTNAVLEGLRTKDIGELNGWFPMLIVNQLGSDIALAGQCWIVKPPTFAMGKNPSMIEWTIDWAFSDIRNLGLIAVA